VNFNNVRSGINRTHNYLKLNRNGTSFKKNKSNDPKKKKKKKNKENQTSFNCGIKGHYICECMFLKNEKKGNGNSSNMTNVLEEIIDLVTEMRIYMIIEVHMAAATNPSNKLFDYGAILHACAQ